jgi:hypothetical protein
MNKFLVSAVLFLLLSVPCFAKTNYGFVYFDIKKETNSAWLMKLPAVEYSFTENNIIHELDLSLDFTMQRNASVPNHYGIHLGYDIGFEIKGWFATVGVGVWQVFDGNDYGFPAGTYFDNRLKVGRQIFQ